MGRLLAHTLTANRKKFVFYEEPTLAFCLVYGLVAVALAHGAFRRPFKSVQEVFDLTVPPGRDVLRLKFRPALLRTPFFRDVEWTDMGYRVSDHKAFPYHKYRDQHVHLCRLVGMEQQGELYDLRRGSGRNIHSELRTGCFSGAILPTSLTVVFYVGTLIPEEADQVMGHHGDTYRQFYLPDLIERDFSSIYFGTPPQDDLVRAVARMGLAWDKRAPTELTPEQKQEVRNHPELARLRQRRDRHRRRLRRIGFYPLHAGVDHPRYALYKELDRKINSVTTVLKKQRLEEEIRRFHDTIDDLEIERQLDGRPVAQAHVPRAVQFESPERALVAQFISLSLEASKDSEALGGKIAFIEALVGLCRQQEHQRCPDKYDRQVVRADREAVTPLDRALTAKSADLQPLSSISDRLQEVPASHGMSTAPQIFQDQVCLLCGKGFSRKSALKRHLESHDKAGWFAQPFQCRVSGCAKELKNKNYYMNHCATAHGVFH